MQMNYTKERAKGKHLTLAERGQIETFVKLGLTNKEIALRIARPFRENWKEVLKKYSRDDVRDKRIRKTGGLPPRLNGEIEQKRADNQTWGQEIKVCSRGC